MNKQNPHPNLNRNKNLIINISLFIISFALIFIYIRLQNIGDFPFDSGDYWNLSLKFLDDNGHFSFINYIDDRRGYLLPFFLFLIRSFSDLAGFSSILLFWITSSIFFATLAVILLPLYFENVFNIRLNIISRILFIITLYYFWRGSFPYPLSDLLSLFFILLSVLLVKKVYDSSSLAHRLLYAFFAGVFVYTGYNIRPVYLPIILLQLVFISVYKKIEIKKRMLVITLLIIGILITSIPQIMVNMENFKNFSPLVEAEWRDQDLYFFNLREGLNTQKYLTNINTDVYPSNKVIFREGLSDLLDTESIASYSDYVRLAVKNPFTISLIYSKHIFNGISVFYPEIYVRDIFQSRNLFVFLNYSLWFIFLVTLLRGKYKLNKLQSVNWLFIITLIVPIILVIPLQAVSRFYLPLFVLCYGFIYSLLSMEMKNINFKSTRATIKKINKDDISSFLRYLVIYLIFILTCFTLSTNIFLSLVIP